MNKPTDSDPNESQTSNPEQAATESASSVPPESAQSQTEISMPSETSSIPVADIGPSRLTQAADWTGSYMWLVAAACLIVAVGLVWWSLPERGIAINIHFPEGHGLQAEDAVRFRGIDVGVVEEVKLNAKLTGVDVLVNLNPSAQSLAREGTRFWIVRPELSLAGISGLETAVGHKYIGLIPAADNEAPYKWTFEGLPSSPADALAVDGMELIIRSEKKYSVSAGSPVTCRGVDIGRILSVGLSQDARFVDVRARIFEKYTKLVTTKSKFWATSGVDLDFSFGDGLKLDIESLETIARGGVSMLTTESGGQPVKPGHVFTPLHAKPADGWYNAAKLVTSTDVELRGVLPLELQWQHNGLFGQSTKTSTFNGIPFRDRDGNAFALIPTDALLLPKKGMAGSMKLAPIGVPDLAIPITAVQPDPDATVGIMKLPISSSFSSNWLNEPAARQPTEPEDCLAVRAAGEPRSLTYLHFSIEQADIGDNDGDWVLNSFDGDRDVWHGSPVLSETDGKLIGVLLIGPRQVTILPFDSQMINPQ